MPFVVYVTYRYSRLARPALQEVQQRIGELTADVEENISGVRVVKAFAREAHQRARFERTVARVFSQSMVEARLQARYNPLLGFLPQLGLAAILLVGGREVVHHQLSIGAVQRLLHLPADAALADEHARRLARHGAARERLRASASSRCSTARRR